MIVTERRKALLLFGPLAIGLVPFLFQTFPQTPIEGQFIPVLIAAEAAVYVLFAMISAPDAGWTGAGLVAALLVPSRFVLALIGALILTLASHNFPQSMAELYSSNPISILLQIFLLLTLAPHLLYPIFPRLLSAEAAEVVSEKKPAPVEPEYIVPGALPVGGYVQIYTYDELVEFLRKIVGLEGFLFYSVEGFKLLGDFQFTVDEEAAAVSANKIMDQVQLWMNKLNMNAADRVLVELTDRYAVNAMITPRVRLLAFFTKSTPVEIVFNRVEMIRKTASEFLRSRTERSRGATTYPTA